MPTGITETQKRKCSDFVGAGSISNAVDLLKSEVGMTLKDAKVTVSHISKTGQKCHWCQKDLAASGELECRDCHSLNFVWRASK
jgi:hypothetical protein